MILLDCFVEMHIFLDPEPSFHQLMVPESPYLSTSSRDFLQPHQQGFSPALKPGWDEIGDDSADKAGMRPEGLVELFQKKTHNSQILVFLQGMLGDRTQQWFLRLHKKFCTTYCSKLSLTRDGEEWVTHSSQFDYYKGAPSLSLITSQRIPRASKEIILYCLHDSA